MTNRLQQKMSQCVGRNEKVLACFLTAGYPARDALLPLVQAVEKGGADVIELGMPFSDPLADGPVIQHSSQIALQQGATLEWIFEQVRLMRTTSEIPIALMGYLNPIFTYGPSKFFVAAARAGVDGIILPELPYEESNRYADLFEINNLANILLVTPTTPPERMALIDRKSAGFLYCVSTTGVTGSSKKRIDAGYVRDVKKMAKKNPVMVGFGIKSAADARRAVRGADGVIVGSAIIDLICKGKRFSVIENFVREIKDAMQPT